jgi:hypothetical protein
MEQYIKNIIPNIKQYGKLLSQKEVFINKTWLLVNNGNDFIQYTFKKNYELIISLNGDVIKGKWEILTQNKILIDSTNGTVQLENLFLNQDIIVLLKPSLNEELFILINEEAIKDKNPLDYLKKLEANPNNSETYDDSEYLWIIYLVVFVFVIIIVSVILSETRIFK